MHTDPARRLPLLLVIAGPTGSGKSRLAVRLAEQLGGEIVSCDSVAVYRGMDIGSSKPTPEDRALVPHHLLDVVAPDEPFTAGHYSRLARESIRGIAHERGRLPIVVGGTGLYLRALLDGLAPAPAIDPALRARLRSRVTRHGPARLHRLLRRFDPEGARLIHPNDGPKLVRALEVSLTTRRPFTASWQQERDALTGYQVLQLGLAPPRAELYHQINRRAASMFARGLVPETERLVERYGWDCRAFASLGYAQAVAVLRHELTETEAIAAAQQGHRNYAKRQGTWFRRDPAIRWLPGFGDEAETLALALRVIHQPAPLPARHTGPRSAAG